MHLSPWKLSNMHRVSTWIGDEVVACYKMTITSGIVNYFYM